MRRGRISAIKVLTLAVIVMSILTIALGLVVSCAQVPEEDMHLFARDTNYYNRPTWNDVYSLDDPIKGNTCYFWNDLMSCVPDN